MFAMPVTIGQMMMVGGSKIKREQRGQREREVSSERVIWEKVREERAMWDVKNERNTRSDSLIETLARVDDLLR